MVAEGVSLVFSDKDTNAKATRQPTCKRNTASNVFPSTSLGGRLFVLLPKLAQGDFNLHLLHSCLHKRNIIAWAFGCVSAFFCIVLSQNHSCFAQITKHPNEDCCQSDLPTAVSPSPAVVGKNNSIFSRRGAVLHSSLPDNEVRVPFFVREDCIFVKARVSGKQVDCMVDTGTNGITWPKSLGLKGKQITKGVTYSWADGSIHRGREVRLPTIQIGDYELKEKSSGRTNEPSNVMILGTLAFQEVVLTRDWQQKQLILRSPHYSTRSITPDKSHFVSDFVWRDVNAFSAGLPVFALTIEGRPAHCLFDTGNPTICLKPAFGKKYLRNKKRLRGTIGRGITGSPKEKVDCVPHVTFAFAGLRIRSLACLSADPSAPYDGSYGGKIYKYLRTTIDYPHRRLLFEPYSTSATDIQHN